MFWLGYPRANWKSKAWKTHVDLQIQRKEQKLGGGFKYSLFSPLLWGRFPFCFRWVETINQNTFQYPRESILTFSRCLYTDYCNLSSKLPPFLVGFETLKSPHWVRFFESKTRSFFHYIPKWASWSNPRLVGLSSWLYYCTHLYRDYDKLL